MAALDILHLSIAVSESHAWLLLQKARCAVFFSRVRQTENLLFTSHNERSRANFGLSTLQRLFLPRIYFSLCIFRAERSVKELKEKFMQGKIPDLVQCIIKYQHLMPAF